MRTTTTLLFVCLLAGVAGASCATAGQSDIAAKASTAFTGNLCGLLKPAQIAALDMKGCVARPPIHAAFTILQRDLGHAAASRHAPSGDDRAGLPRVSVRIALQARPAREPDQDREPDGGRGLDQ